MLTMIKRRQFATAVAGQTVPVLHRQRFYTVFSCSVKDWNDPFIAGFLVSHRFTVLYMSIKSNTSITVVNNTCLEKQTLGNGRQEYENANHFVFVSVEQEKAVKHTGGNRTDYESGSQWFSFSLVPSASQELTLPEVCPY